MDHSEARRIFEDIRDRPYQVPTKMGEITPQCYTKSRELVAELTTIGYTAKTEIAEMDWYASPIPSDIIDLHPKNIPTTHFYPKILIDGQWRLIDPSIDPELSRKGFKLVEFEGDPLSCFKLKKFIHQKNKMSS